MNQRQERTARKEAKKLAGRLLDAARRVLAAQLTAQLEIDATDADNAVCQVVTELCKD